jgi:phage terminase large subunit GpA-like protein
MDETCNPFTAVIVVMSSAQVGKTEIVNNILGYHVDHDPCPSLLLQPTLEMAEAYSKDRLAPMVRDTPALSTKIKDARSRDSNNTLLHKGFPGGHVTMCGANSPSSLASRPVRLVLCDEVDRYPASAGTEGDPVRLAIKRANTFWNKKIILVSTPTIKGESRIEKEFELSDKRQYFMPCPHCGHWQTFKWAHIVFDRDDIASTHYACENGCVIEQRHRQKMLAEGEWRATAKSDSGRAGFHINELYSPWVDWAEVVRAFLESKDDPELLKTWTNTSLGETFEIKGTEIGGDDIRERGELYDDESLPDEVLLLTAAVDVQGDRLEAQIYGWGESRERWVFPVQIFWGDPGKPEVWEDLDAWLLKVRRGTTSMRITCCLIDSGGHHTSEVYSFCKPRQKRRVFAYKGSSTHTAPLISNPTQVGKQRVQLYTVGTVAAKDSIKSSLTVQEIGPGYVHFSADIDEEYFDQLLTSEVRKTKKIQGRSVGFYQQKRDRNEGLDLAVMNLAAYAVLNPDIDKIKAKLRKNNEKIEEKPKESPNSLKNLRKKRSRKNSFISGF